MKLSILIPTLPERENFLGMLMASFKDQLKNSDVEVIIDDTDQSISIGEKRNRLLDKAKGDYISFVDDDDIVSRDYVSSILYEITNMPDVIGMHLLHYHNYQLKGLTYHSLKYNKWWEEPHENYPKLKKYYRNPNHLNPVKRELALKVKFPHINMGEDRDYSMRLLPLLKTEKMINHPIYAYLYRSFK
jgi:glycosyltransferase involved in cell wall biosynthesis